VYRNEYNHHDQTHICDDIHRCIIIPECCLFLLARTCVAWKVTPTILKQEPLILSQGLGNEHWKAKANNDVIVHKTMTSPTTFAACFSRVMGVRSLMNDIIESLTKHKLAMYRKFAAYSA